MINLEISGELELVIIEKKLVRDPIGEGMYRSYDSKVEVSKEKEKEILKKLQNNEYVIDLRKREIKEIEHLKTVYYFDFKVKEGVEYLFN
jgi:hypothetical protein